MHHARSQLFMGVLFLSIFAAPPPAEASRFALVAGSNRGGDPAKTLRFAERDAERFASVLTELGGFKPMDVHVLKSPTKTGFLDALQDMGRRIREHSTQGSVNDLALIYFSGHSDGVNLELGEERLPFATLKASLEALGAEVKILIMDSCQSGGVTAYKGGRPGPSFDIVFTDTIDANGTAVLTSSAAGEKSQESGRLMGSFFTHFLLSGLSGTADFDQDRQVTLNEIYQYTYSKTVAETSRTMGGTQHPTYDFRISGRGKVVITDLTLSKAGLLFGPETNGSFLILKKETDEIAAEVTKPRNVWRQVALQPGAYRVASYKDGNVYSTTVQIHSGQKIRINEGDLAPEPRLEKVFEKGAETSLRRGIAISSFYGMTSGALKRYSALHQGIVALRLDAGPVSLFPKFSVGATRIDEDAFQYRLLLITGEGGVAWRFDKSTVDLFLGLNVGAGYGRQQLSDELRQGTIFIYNLLTGLEFPFTNRFVLSVFWEVGSHAYRAEQKLTQHLLLRGSIGVGVHF